MSGVMEYRDDDVKGVGFCPQCRAVLGDVKLSGIAFCEEHGWVFVDWGQLPSEEEVRYPNGPKCPDCKSSETTLYPMGDGHQTLYCDSCKREEPFENE